ncbi:unnamed protein product [Clavelina lepadiformis]|uniref:Carbohydrate sulfotransferase n=1 Tax=Clavelina lepadiformis TaxID=159417 RepID=A0ABP0EWA0_CLALP
MRIKKRRTACLLLFAAFYFAILQTNIFMVGLKSLPKEKEVESKTSIHTGLSPFTETIERKKSTSINRIFKEIGLSVLPLSSYDVKNDHEIEQRFKDRLTNATKMCKAHGKDYQQSWKNIKTSGGIFGNFVASYEHRAMICLVLKSGSQTWNNFFWRIRAPEEAEDHGFFDKAERSQIAAFNAISRERKIELLKDDNAVRIINVRHPLARLASGWANKFTKEFYYHAWFKWFPAMLNYPNKYGKWNGSEDGHFMEFVDFAHYVADYGTKSSGYLDPHFKPMLSLCDPCKFPFNYITKLETFNTDARWITENKLNISSDVISPLNVINQSKDPALFIKEYFSQLEPDVIERILSIYKVDMETFGYTFNITTLTAGGWEKETSLT